MLWKRNISVLWQLTADLVISVFCCVWDNLALMSLLSIEISARFHSNWAKHCKIIYLPFRMNAIDDVLFQGCLLFLKFLWVVSKAWLCMLSSFNTLQELFTQGWIHVRASGRWPVRDEYTSLECCSLRSRARFALFTLGFCFTCM